jgi:hypothetical protein
MAEFAVDATRGGSMGAHMRHASLSLTALAFWIAHLAGATASAAPHDFPGAAAADPGRGAWPRVAAAAAWPGHLAAGGGGARPATPEERRADRPLTRSDLPSRMVRALQGTPVPTDPVTGTVVLAKGAPYVTGYVGSTIAVEADYTASSTAGSVTAMRTAAGASVEGAAWRVFEPTEYIPVSVAEGRVLLVVSAQFRDEAGRVSPVVRDDVLVYGAVPTPLAPTPEPEPFTVRGQALRRWTGEPVAGATVSARVRHGTCDPPGITGGDGRFMVHCQVFRSTVLVLGASAQGYLDWSSEVALQAGLAPALDVTIELEPIDSGLRPVRGSVRLADGAAEILTDHGTTNEIDLDVDFAATSPVSEVVSMRVDRRYALRRQGACAPLAVAPSEPWQPFVRATTWRVKPSATTFDTYNVTVQYRDRLGNLSRRVCDDVRIHPYRGARPPRLPFPIWQEHVPWASSGADR